MARLSIFLFGSFQVTLDDQPVTGFATDKARALLAYLAVEADHPHRRDSLAGLLWPEQPERKAQQNLRQALSHLRQAIGDDGEGETFLQITREAIQFNSHCSHALDVAAFTALFQTCQNHRHARPASCLPCLRRLEQMVGLYRGEFLEQFFLGDSAAFEEWASLKREWFHRQALEALTHLAEYYERRGDYGQARQYAWRQVELEPWREEAHRQLMRLLALDGQRSAALVQYESCRQALAQELGIEPTAETVALYKQIAGQAEALSFGDLGSAPLHNLPRSPTPFVGRQEEQAELAELIANPDCRLVTLVGPGGIGKTRLALQVAADHVGAFAHGVYFVPLAPIESAEFIIPSIAESLGFSFQGRQDTSEQLANYLRDAKRELLLVLDSLEHLISPPAGDSAVKGGAELLAELLKRAPGIKVLTTSRARLNLQEEWVYEVEGLSYPPPQPRPVLPTPSPETYSAIKLFLECARRVQRRFALSETEWPGVARICQLVEGMPLGVELAAAWVRTRTCQEIAADLARNLDILTTSLANVPERQRSMRATFEHSWGLLSEQERAAFRRLSAFHGGFGEQAAEQVAGASPSILAALVDKSLLRRGAAGRYEWHELLRQSGAEKLAASAREQAETLDRHSAYYAAFLDQRQARLQGHEQKQTLQEISAEIENVRAGWYWAIARGRTADIARSLKSLDLYYETHDWYQEGLEAFSRAADGLAAHSAPGLIQAQVMARQARFAHRLGRYEQAGNLARKSLEIFEACSARSEKAFALNILANVLCSQGEYAEAEQLLQASLAICQESGNRYEMAWTLSLMGNAAARLGQPAQAKVYWERGLALCQDLGAQQSMAEALSNLGRVAGILGEYAEARQHFQASLAICQELGDRRGMAASLHNLSTLAYLGQDYAEAKRLRQKTLAICREIGYPWGIASSLKGLGDVARQMGEHKTAQSYLRQSLAAHQDMGDRWGQAQTLTSLGLVARALGARREAWSYFRQALKITLDLGALPALLDILNEMAQLMAEEGKTKQALEWAAFVLSQPSAEKQTRDPLEQLRAGLLSLLPAREAAAAQARGQQRTLEDMAAEALGE